MIIPVIQVRKQYLRRLDSLMTDKDTIDLCYLKVLLVGPPGVGKTTTLNRMLKEYENIRTAGDKAKRRSTLLANCTQVLAFVGQDKTADWLSSDSGDNDEEAALLIQYLCGGEPKHEEMMDTNEVQFQTYHESSNHSEITTEELESSPANKETNQDHPRTEKQFTASKEDSIPQHLILMKEQLRGLVGSRKYTKAISQLGNTLLNINDVGGQPGFLEMLPALSSGPAIYLVFFDLSKELDRLYEITFDRDNTVITPFKSLHSVESIISQILSSIASAHCLSRESASKDLQKAVFFGERFKSFQEIQPIAALIGTHLDKVEDQEKRIQETSESVKKITEKFSKIIVTPQQNVATANPGISSPFFSVNNYDGEEGTDIAPIRQYMSDIVQSRFQDASLPVQKKWLILNIILRREFCIVEMANCFEIGKMLDIEKEDLKFCLWYLDCIGTLMHYTNIADDEDGWFKNHVICSPQVIFDSISQLIVASLRMLHSGGPVTNYEREDLMNKGQFSINSIEMYCKNVLIAEKLKEKKLIPAKQLIQLLKHVNLLSPIKHKEFDGEHITYLMPAVLDSATQTELATPPTPDEDNPEPILITFECGYVPTGTFCGLITQLVSNGPDGLLQFVWTLVEDGVKRNYISFYVEYVNKVTLICHDRCYEVRVTRDDPDISLHELCTHVLLVILHILRELYEKLTPELAFWCPCSAKRNLCTLVGSGSKKLLCTHEKRRRALKLKDSQQVWIGKVRKKRLFYTRYLYSLFLQQMLQYLQSSNKSSSKNLTRASHTPVKERAHHPQSQSMLLPYCYDSMSDSIITCKISICIYFYIIIRWTHSQGCCKGSKEC